VLALVTRHAAAAAAKRAVEVAMADGEGVIEVPAIESAAALDDELSRAGFRVSRVREAPSALDVRALRARMALSSAAFARRYGFNTRTVEGWEQGRPIDTASAILLQVIATDPSAVARVMETPLTDRHDAS
jgi:DNA-binding transcriptional regulator YiaG